MLLLAALIVAAAPPAAAQPEKSGVPGKSTKCLRSNAYIAGTDGRYDGKPLAPQKLAELPPANMYVAVDRFDENGCLTAIVVKTSLGR